MDGEGSPGFAGTVGFAIRLLFGQAQSFEAQTYPDAVFSDALNVQLATIPWQEAIIEMEVGSRTSA